MACGVNLGCGLVFTACMERMVFTFLKGCLKKETNENILHRLYVAPKT